MDEDSDITSDKSKDQLNMSMKEPNLNLIGA